MLDREFMIVSHAIEGSAKRSVSARNPHEAVTMHIALHHPGYSFTGGLKYSGTGKWMGEAKLIIQAIREHDIRGGWYPEGVTINWEDSTLYCCHTGEQIECAYHEDETS